MRNYYANVFSSLVVFVGNPLLKTTIFATLDHLLSFGD